MVDTNLRNEFLERHSASCDPEQLLKHYNFFYEKYSNGDCPQRSAGLGDSLWYMKRLLTKFSPQEGMIKMLGDIQGFPYTKAHIEDAYIFYLVRVAWVEEHYKEYVAAAFFAKKALDMIDYFHPHLNKLSKEKIIREDENYKNATEIFELYKHHLEEYLRRDYPDWDCLFDWEREIILPTKHANQNFQYRIHF